MSRVITRHFEQLIEKCIASGSREDLSRVIQTALLDTRPLIPASELIRRRRRWKDFQSSLPLLPKRILTKSRTTFAVATRFFGKG